MKASELNLERIQHAQNVINDLALCCMVRDKTAFEKVFQNENYSEKSSAR